MIKSASKNLIHRRPCKFQSVAKTHCYCLLCCLLSGSSKPRHVIAHFVCVEIYSQSSSGSNFIHNQNSLSLPALLTRRLGPSPPPCQPCEALIFPPCVALCLLHLHHLHHSETDFPAFPEFTSRRLSSSTGSQVSTSQSSWTTINQLKFGAVREASGGAERHLSAVCPLGGASEHGAQGRQANVRGAPAAAAGWTSAPERRRLH